MKTGQDHPLIERIQQRFMQLPDEHLIFDANGKRFTPREVIHLSNQLARLLKPTTISDHYVGLLLPTSAIGIILALTIKKLGKVPVFLNYTTSQEAINYAITQCDIKHIITSQAFVDALKFPSHPAFVFGEDLLSALSQTSSSHQIPRSEEDCDNASTAPSQHKNQSSDINDIATILFSSGSTGTPKGIMLTQSNLISNLDAIIQVLALNENDVMMGCLPLFHSFGFIGNFLLPLYRGFKVVYHANPMDAVRIGELIQEYQCTMLFATPSFLQGYMRRCKPEQLRSLRLVIAGAEKLHPSIADQFYQKFGVLPIEGYGCTELSPVVSVNAPENLSGKVVSCGKSGSVGRTLPGVTVKIIAPETGASLPCDEEGLVYVHGPNVMKGYLRDPERSNEVLRDGWYKTGDIGKVDKDGYLYITGRLARFSKIAGEMVSHGAVEDAINQIIDSHEKHVVVTSAPDLIKGEKLLVLHLPLSLPVGDILKGLRDQGLPNLWIPKEKDFHEIDRIPLLGSGKLDLSQLKLMAQHVLDGQNQ